MFMRNFLKTLCLMLTAVGSVSLAFFCLDSAQAVFLVKHFGYWLILLNLLLLVALCYREFRGLLSGAVVWRRLSSNKRPLLFIAAVSLVMIFQQQPGFKIVMDEPVIASTALRMHEHREVMTTVRAHEIQGAFTQLDGYVDKRPYFYPFLVSVLHDLTGYRSLNGVLLNHLLLPLLLLLIYLFGDRFAPGRGGYLAVGLCATLPLLAMSANGAGLDLLNVVMILLCFFAAEHYMRNPEARSENILILTCMLLAQTRYESVVFVFATALVLVLGWYRVRRPLLSWVTVISPFFLIPYGLQRIIFKDDALAYELREGAAEAFALAHIPDNLVAAADFFFNLKTTTYPNSFLISLLFVCALLFVLVALPRQLKRYFSAVSPKTVVSVAFSAVLVFNVFLLMSYHWGQLNDIMATRIALPFMLFQILFSVGVLLQVFRGRIYHGGLCAATAVFFVGFTLPSNAKNNYLQWVPGQHETVWVQEKAKKYKEDKVLFITDMSVVVLAERVPGLAPLFVKRHKAKFKLLMQLRAYDEAFVVFRYIKGSETSADYVTDWPVYKDFDLEIIEMEKLGEERFIVLGRVEKVKMLDEDRNIAQLLQSVPETEAGKSAFLAELLP